MTRKNIANGLVLVVCLLLYQPIFSVSSTSDANHKAALIFKLINFVHWPEHSFENKFTICTLGKDELADALDEISGRKIKGKAILVQHFHQSQSIGRFCQVAVISESKQPFFQEIVKPLEKFPILTISDGKKFAIKGGMIQLDYRDNKVKFKINLSPVKRSGLTISSPFIELSTIVGQ